MTQHVVHDSHRLRCSVGALVGVLIVGVCWTDSFLGNASNAWAVVAIIAACALVGDVLPDVARLLPGPGATTFTVIVVLVAIFGCVPETDQISDIGLIVGTVGVIEVMAWRPMRLAWHAVAAGLVMWAGVFGATGRDRAFIGTLFAFWPIVLLGGLSRIFLRLAWASPLVRSTIVAFGGAAAITVARTGALRPGRWPALRDAGVAAIASLAASVCVVLVSTRATRSRQTR